MDLNGDKNSKLSKDLNASEEVGLKTRVFSFFYYVLRKKDISLLLCVIFLILESLQLISYAFSDPHTSLWNIDTNTMYYIQLVVAATRIAPLMTLLSFNYYLIIYGSLMALIFLYSLIFATVLRINRVTSKFYQGVISFTRYSAAALQIFLLIPISELLLIMIKCDSNNKISIFSDSITCWSGLHFLYAFLSVIFCLLFFFLAMIITIFYFDPFNSKRTATKIDTNADTFLFIFKAISVIRFVALGSDWISIVLMVIASLLNMKRSYENTTYNNTILECIISIRNAVVFWTYVVLLICKILSGTSFNGQIFLLLVGYPLVIIFSIYYFKRKSKNFMISNSNFNDANEYLSKLKSLKILIEAFLNRSKNSKSNKSNNLKKDEILLKGYITIHEETCVMDECPLKKFIEDNGNYALQRLSLLHYMNLQFSEGIKKFPNSKAIFMNFVQFNYEKKYNLNSAKAYLAKLEKSQNTIGEDFILYSIKQNINSNSNNKLNRSYTNDDEILKIEDSTEHKFKRLRTLIENSTKLYGEFWGNLSTNLTNNLNLRKLFFVGNKLNKILVEINQLWELDLKNKKIDMENQGVIQLYAYFLREILKNKKKSDEISKRVNEEQHYENRRTDNDHLDVENLDAILENQEMVIYARANEKGEVTIIQCSNSVVAITGYTKQEVIGARAEVLMPSIYQEDHAAMIGKSIKKMRTSMSTNREALKAAMEKRVVFVLPKTKTGYLMPINNRFGIYNDDDFSNNYIIKLKMEYKDTKSVYAYYILTKDDYTVDSISSSCLNLGISMDLLKKYIINMNYLVRSEHDEEMDLASRFTEFEEEPKKVIFLNPELLYPKGEVIDINSKTDQEREQLIQESKRESFNMLIVRLQYKEDKILGYCFRMTSVEQKKHSQDGNEIRLSFNSKKNIMYDVLKLCYMRTNLVNVKVIQNQEFENINVKDGIFHNFDLNKTINKSSRKEKSVSKRRKEDERNSEDEEEGEKGNEDNVLTKEKIAEYQAKNADDIRSFILSLPFFGHEVTYFKRDTELKNPYEDHYNKTPNVKQILDEFAKKMSQKRIEKREVNTTNKTEGANKSNELNQNMDYMSDTSSSLNNIFNDKSVTNIKYFSFFMFLFLCIIITIEFFISLSIIQDINDRMYYSDKAFKILNALLYTKYFITESVLAQSSSYISIEKYYQGNNTQYIIDQMIEMSNYRQVISDTYSFFSNATVTFNDEYYDYVNNQMVYIRTLSNGLPSAITNPFSIAISRIPTTIFYVSTVNDNYNTINMFNRNAYELMMNLLNDYLIVWQQLTFILVRDVKSHTVSDSRLLIIFAISFIISIISIFGIRFLFNKFIDDREKPVDLFLTIKKQKFEELKFSSEAFLNKLLNKFFGNEEAEEEMMSESAIRIKPDDIIIAKFKQKNDYKQSIRTSSEYLLILFKIFIFFIIFQAYMAFKYAYITLGMQNLNHFTDVFNVTQYSQSDLILSCNVAKQFYYDPTIPMFNTTNTAAIFQNNIVKISDSIESMIQTTYSNINYISSAYLTSFMSNLNQNINGLINTTYSDVSIYYKTPNYGFKAVVVRYFELIRFLGISYFQNKDQDFLNTTEFMEIDSILKNIIRNWYNNLLNDLMTSFSDFINQTNLINVSTFVVLIVFIIVIYIIVWKGFEENLKDLLKTSVDLINLIPESFKYIIVQKLNEEDENRKE